MTINEAYVKGLDDAENRVIETINKYIKNDSYETFQNPNLQEAWSRLTTRANTPQTPEPSDKFRNQLHDVLIGKSPKIESETDNTLLSVVKVRSDQYRSMADGRTAVGKKFKKNIEEQLQSLNDLLN